MNDFDEAGKMYTVIERIVLRVLEKMNFVRAIPATVTAVSSSNITAYLIGDEISNTSVYQNRTNTTIAPGDIVYVVLPNNKLTNSFVGWKV